MVGYINILVAMIYRGDLGSVYGTLIVNGQCDRKDIIFDRHERK